MNPVPNPLAVYNLARRYATAQAAKRGLPPPNRPSSSLLALAKINLKRSTRQAPKPAKTA